MPYGRSLLTTSSVFPTRVSADGSPRYKPGGVTLDLTTITAASGSAITLPDGSVIAANAQFMRYGQILTRIGVAEVQTLTYTGGATAGAATITLPASGEYPAQTAAAVAFDVSAANMQAALVALSRIGVGGVVVGRTGAGTNGDPYIYTYTFNRLEGDVPQLTSTHTFTGGTTPTTTHATTTGSGTASGKFGPYDPAASDGRQTLARGDCFILDETWLYYPSGPSFAAGNDIIGGVFDAGDAWFERILQSYAVTSTLALGPTLATFEAAFPGILYYKN